MVLSKPTRWPVVLIALALSANAGYLSTEACAEEIELDEFALRLRDGLKDKASGFWIYDDLEAGYAGARQAGKPLLVSFRCVP